MAGGDISKEEAVGLVDDSEQPGLEPGPQYASPPWLGTLQVGQVRRRVSHCNTSDRRRME